ncbi:hypothetical protein GTO27_09320 [Candidatus Bathyarchaeota archaeon]|nr:hypothetical protein [Candidatus Bathyarchaeota archaeon]
MRFSALFTAGAVVLIIGFILQWVPHSIVLGLEERLDDTDITQDERTKVQRALSSWRVMQMTTFKPCQPYSSQLE